ncbi:MULTISPECIES: cell division protein [unclassified Neisseria]|uniref:cell division protein n=1 Tax=unclassified Neisseria TaxID=2623750 RepID=UPI001071B08F|nr:MULTISPECIES: cell division protein [unclassified Neisseria]MBF0804009.1 cell division protein [Neisseria sp. 19428wB4_WF04]TFU43278.1 cell division protein [Neisseria sp. WF04]
MKWLFAVLVALNVIVFGGMVASRVVEKQKNAAAPAQSVGVPQQQPVPAPAEILHPAPVSAPEREAAPIQVSAASESESDESRLMREKAELEAKEKEAKELEAKAQKEREEKAKREQLEKAKREQERQKAAEAKKENNLCTSPASLTLEEDDYHRIKGLLRQWPHAASRTVEKRDAGQVQKTYRVLISADGDAAAMLDSLAAKGFSGSIYEGGISVGVTHSRSAAQVLISRLASAGFGGTRIHEQEDRGASPEGGLSVAKMQVTFMDVDDKSAQEIQKVVSRYGKLNRRPCR